MSTTTGTPILGALVRQEIGNYLRHKLFWVGAALWALLCVASFTMADKDYSTVGDGLGSAFVLGVFGLVIMGGLVRDSDRAAAGSAVPVPQRTRTLALAATAVVPLAMGLIWFGCAVGGYLADPPSDFAGPFGEHSRTDFWAGMFAEGVVPAAGGPLLGLVVARWLAFRGAAVLVAVGVVAVTVAMQWADGFRLPWIWIHFFGPSGIEGDRDRMVANIGSPYPYIAYQAVLCVLGVLVATYRDPEADHGRLRRAVAATAAVAALLCGTSYALGPQHEEISPYPSPSAGRTS